MADKVSSILGGVSSGLSDPFELGFDFGVDELDPSQFDKGTPEPGRFDETPATRAKRRSILERRGRLLDASQIPTVESELSMSTGSQYGTGTRTSGLDGFDWRTGTVIHPTTGEIVDALELESELVKHRASGPSSTPSSRSFEVSRLGKGYMRGHVERVASEFGVSDFDYDADVKRARDAMFPRPPAVSELPDDPIDTARRKLGQRSQAASSLSGIPSGGFGGAQDFWWDHPRLLVKSVWDKRGMGRDAFIEAASILTDIGHPNPVEGVAEVWGALGADQPYRPGTQYLRTEGFDAARAAKLPAPPPAEDVSNARRLYDSGASAFPGTEAHAGSKPWGTRDPMHPARIQLEREQASRGMAEQRARFADRSAQSRFSSARSKLDDLAKSYGFQSMEDFELSKYEGRDYWAGKFSPTRAHTDMQASPEYDRLNMELDEATSQRSSAARKLEEEVWRSANPDVDPREELRRELGQRRKGLAPLKGERGFISGVAPTARSTAARGLSTAMGVAAAPVIDYALDPESRTPVQFARAQEQAITSMVPGLVSPSELPPPAVLPPDRLKAVEATQGMAGVAPDTKSPNVTEQEVRAYISNKVAKGDKLPAWAQKITSMKGGRLSIKPVNPRTKARQEAAKSGAK